MTIDLEDRIRTSLHRRADAVHVEVPEPDLLRPFAAPRRSRRTEVVAVAAALALFVGAGLLVALAGRESAAPPVTGGPTSSAPAVGDLGRVVHPGALVAMPAPWRMDRFTFVSASSIAEERVGVLDGSERGVIAPAAMVEYGFSDGSRTLQVNFYEMGVRDPQVTTPTPPLVGVRGTTGYFLDYGGGRYRVQWDEGGRTWEVDGYGFASLDEVVAVLATLEWQDDATWAAAAPTGLADAILENRASGVTWTSAEGVLSGSTTTPPPDGSASTRPPTTSSTLEPSTTTSIEPVVTTVMQAGPPSTTTTTSPPSVP